MSLARLKMELIRAQLSEFLASKDLEHEILLSQLVMRMAVTNQESAKRLLTKRRT